MTIELWEAVSNKASSCNADSTALGASICVADSIDVTCGNALTNKPDDPDEVFYVQREP